MLGFKIWQLVSQIVVQLVHGSAHVWTEGNTARMPYSVQVTIIPRLELFTIHPA